MANQSPLVEDKAISDDVSALEVENVSNHLDIDHEAERNVRVKTDIYLLPMLCLLFIIAFLDRTNIGNARIQGLEKDLKMKGNDYNIALFIFFIPYAILDIPANILMKKLRPSIYLSSIILCWGIVTVCEGVTKSFTGLILCRVCLGIFEAGFYPGAIYLISMYYTRYELHVRISIWYSAGLISTAFGGLLAYGISHMDGVGGYRAWRWIFIIEGLLTVLVALFSYWALPDWPEQAKFLKEEERKVLLQKLARDTGDFVESKATLVVLNECLTDPKVWLSAIMYFGCAVTGSSTSYFLPTILRQLGWTSLKAQYMSIPVWIAAWVATVANGFISDKLHHRASFFIGALFLAVIGYALLLASDRFTVAVRYMALFFVVIGNFSAIAVALTWLNNNIIGTKRRGISTAAILAFGNCGSVLGSNVYLSSEAPRYSTGYSVSLASLILSQISGCCYLLYLWHENKQKLLGKRDHLLSLPLNEQDQLGDRHPSYRYTY